MRTGKTHVQISLVAKSLNEGKSFFVAGMKSPKEYTERLFKYFGITVVTAPHYVKRNYNITFEHIPPYRVWESGGEEKLTGFEFKKL